MLSFEWDERKNRANQKKHGVSFEEAQSVFFDEHALGTMIPAIQAMKTASYFLVTA